MFNLFRNTAEKKNRYFPFTTDIHSHILPGIDDGSPDVETSILLIRGLMELGITRSVATPHIIGDMYRNDAGTINAALASLQQELKTRNIPFEVSAAAEYMIDGYFFDLLAEKQKLLTLKDNLLLTEFSYSSRPDHLEQMSFTIVTEGYIPILAHPERYAYFHNDMQMYQRLKDIGFLLQVNLLSLTGYYGKDVARAAIYIIKNDMASFVGTDLHHDRHLSVLSHPRTISTLEKYLSQKTWNHF
jgi:tyrosine-protein phosphatase YwqE